MRLKRAFLTTVFLLFCSSASAAHLDLAWDPNSEPDVAGYVVYYGTYPGQYFDWIDLGKTTSARIVGLIEDTEYFLALTAYDVFGNESDFSGEVSGVSLPGDNMPMSAGGSSSGGGCFISTGSDLLPASTDPRSH